MLKRASSCPAFGLLHRTNEPVPSERCGWIRQISASQSHLGTAGIPRASVCLGEEVEQGSAQALACMTQVVSKKLARHSTKDTTSEQHAHAFQGLDDFGRVYTGVGAEGARRARSIRGHAAHTIPQLHAFEHCAESFTNTRLMGWDAARWFLLTEGPRYVPLLPNSFLHSHSDCMRGRSAARAAPPWLHARAVHMLLHAC